MTIELNGVEITDFYLNGVEVGKAYFNGTLIKYVDAAILSDDDEFGSFNDSNITVSAKPASSGDLLVGFADVTGRTSNLSNLSNGTIIDEQDDGNYYLISISTGTKFEVAFLGSGPGSFPGYGRVWAVGVSNVTTGHVGYSHDGGLLSGLTEGDFVVLFSHFNTFGSIMTLYGTLTFSIDRYCYYTQIDTGVTSLNLPNEAWYAVLKP
jgi:hypothetical protein